MNHCPIYFECPHLDPSKTPVLPLASFCNLPQPSVTTVNIVNFQLSIGQQRPGMASLQSPMMQVDMAAATRQQRFQQALHYIAPALVLGYFLIATAISACTLQNLKPRGTGPRKILVPLVCLVTISCLVESCMLLTDTATTAVNDARHSSTDSNVSTFPREPRRQSSHTLVADQKLIRFTHSSHCSSGQA